MVTKYVARTYGADIVARKLRGMAMHADNLRPAWPAVSRRAVVGYRRAFELQGPGWRELKASTIRKRIAEGYSPGPILHKTGRMEARIMDPEIEEGEDFLRLIINDPTMRYHQGGTKKMVARPIRLRSSDGKFMSQEVANYILAGYRVG